MSKKTISAIIIAVVAVGIIIYFMTRPTPADQSNYQSPTNPSDTSAVPATTAPADKSSNKKIMNQATIQTNMGTIVIQLDPEHAPNTVANFEKLANSGFYSNVKFHRVIKGFMIQGGDPLSKQPFDAMTNRWGTGGPGYAFADELTGKETYPQGTLAMANAGPNTNGSQFFIVTASPAAPLHPDYTVFGKVIKGMDVALKIENVQTDASDRPTNDVVIEKVTIE